jgi:exopolysaccharide biosynthesis polyprenyl glycosylphosphotransferase
MSTTAAVRQVRSDRVESSFFYGTHPTAFGRAKRVGSSLFVLADFLLVVLSGLLALGLQFHETPALALRRQPGSEIAPSLLLLPLLAVLFCHSQRLYSAGEIAAMPEKSWAILKAIGSAWFMLAVYLHLSRAAGASRVGVTFAALVSTVVLLLWHIYGRGYVSVRIAGGSVRHALIMGNSGSAQNLRDYLSANKELGYLVKGFLNSRPDVPGAIHGDDGQIATDDVLGSIDELGNILRAYFIDELLIALPADRHLVKQAVAVARECDIPVRIVADLYGGVAACVRVDPLGPFPALSIPAKPFLTLGLLLKRGVDILLAGLALIASSPVWLAIAIAIKLDSPGSVLYRSTRVGKKSATFTCLKFRTMIERAEALQEKLRDLNERDGVLFKIEKDPRITRVGRFLRKYSLDELPQFWNVLKGDMSLVGPRPSLPTEVVQYELEHLKRLTVLPGITGLWQIEARRDPSFEKYIKLDTEYVDRWSFWLDLKIMSKTPRIVLGGTGQ